MTMVEHLDELRKRLGLALLGLGAGAVIGYIFAPQIMAVILRPAGTPKLTALTVLEPFLAKFKTALITGVALSMPWLLYQVFAFIRPALTPQEKKAADWALVGMAVLFYTGVVFGYVFILPASTRWLLAQGGDIIQVQLTALAYVGYVAWFMVGVGLAFETPLLIVALAWLGIVSPATLRKEWRIAYMVIFTASAVLTPDWSPVTMFMVAAPMIVLYELSIVLCRILFRQRAAAQGEAGTVQG
ncbi:MAG: twin-arginine translocase subunit TatC [Armatimonadetes bacterium]|nr:twin-arginine translocase subunit TatC [Armatimonadota bacterium]